MNFSTLSMPPQADEDRFRALMDIVPHLVWMAGPDKRCIYFNHEWLKFTGRPVAKELGHGWTDNIHVDDVKRWVATYEQAFQAHRPFSIEYRLRRHDGAYRWLLHTANPMFSRAKDVFEGYIGACVDITDRKSVEEDLREARAKFRAESELRTNEALLRAVFASLYGNVAVVDREGCIISANGAWTQFARYTTGFSKEACLGANYLDVCRRAAAAGDRSAAAAVNGIESVLLAHAPGYSQEYSCPSEHGPWYELVIVPLRRPEGGALIFHIDVTSRVRAEGEAQRLRNELSHVTRVSILGELVASLAHELNQPLTAILSNTQAALRLLGKGASAPAELREILEDIAMDDQRAGEIIRRLRQLTRKGEFVLQHIDVNQLVREVYGLLESDSLIRRVPMECRFGPDLPPVLGDRIQLEQVLLNLMVNGLESMKDLPQDGNLRLVVSTRRASEASIIVAVKDRGIGVTPDKQGSIFKPFFSTKPDGMGMGLSICRTIVLAHNGRIGVSNNPDGGATFEVELPTTREVSSGSG